MSRPWRSESSFSSLTRGYYAAINVLQQFGHFRRGREETRNHPIEDRSVERAAAWGLGVEAATTFGMFASRHV